MSTEAQPRFATFEDFYEALDGERHLSQRLSDHPGVRDQLRESLHKMYDRIQGDPEFEKQLAESPQETALAFFHDEIAHYTLSDEDLESVAGGESGRFRPEFEDDLEGVNSLHSTTRLPTAIRR